MNISFHVEIIFSLLDTNFNFFTAVISTSYTVVEFSLNSCVAYQVFCYNASKLEVLHIKI